MTDLGKDLEALLNGHCVENASDTPDFVLAEYLLRCLAAYEKAVRQRDSFFSHHPWGHPGPPQ